MPEITYYRWRVTDPDNLSIKEPHVLLWNMTEERAGEYQAARPRATIEKVEGSAITYGTLS